MAQQANRKGLWILLLVLAGLFLFSFLAGRWGLFEEERISLSGDKVAVLPIHGVLNDSEGILREVEEYKEQENVKALVLRIDSPGGTVVAAQEIFAEVQKLRGKKIVLASLGNVAASGGYYVACAAQEIVANPGTLTGSIGVISQYGDYRELMQKIGFRTRTLKSGRFKDIGNPNRDMTDEERRILQDVLDNIHRQFIRDVADGRGRTVEEVEPWADGRVFTGEQAKELGLVDRLGNLQDTIARAAELAGIEGKPEVLYPKEKRKKVWEYLIRGLLEGLEAVLVSSAGEMNPSFIHLDSVFLSGREMR